MIFSCLKRLTEEEAKYGDIKPLTLIHSKIFLFNFSSTLLFLLEDSVIVFVKFSEVFLIVSVTGSKVFSYTHESFVHLICLVILIHLLGFVTKLTLLIFPNILYFELTTTFMIIKKVSFLECIQYECFYYNF